MSIETKLQIKIMADYFECQEDEITQIVRQDENIKATIDDMEVVYTANMNLYHYGVLLKEYIEDYAKSLHLGAVWIDLNDLSKDETYYFKHCYEVYEQLAQYDLIMESEEL
jgi:hypothetical protein